MDVAKAGVEGSPLKAPVVQSFAGVSLNGVVISYKNETQQLAGVDATLESPSDVATRRVGRLPLTLTIVGEKYTWEIELSPRLAAPARQFVARLNAAARP